MSISGKATVGRIDGIDREDSKEQLDATTGEGTYKRQAIRDLS